MATNDKTILHAVVGFKLPTYFLNCVRSVRAAAPSDDLLVVDNNSRLPGLTSQLEEIAASDSRVRLITRTDNNLTNTKVGGLYDAYREIVSYALEQRYQYLHLIQGDMQMLWRDSSVLEEAERIFDQFPNCIEVFSLAMTSHLRLGDEIEPCGERLLMVRKYGLNDVGIYHLGRWREHDIQFRNAETAHGQEYLERGFRIVCHPWPTVAQIPWPVVVRHGRQLGTEIELRQEFLLRPLDDVEISQVKQSTVPIWLEDICVPWDWICLTPMWITDLNSIYYWVFTYRDMRARGISAIPRWERRGVVTGGRIGPDRRRPRLWQIFFRPLWAMLRRR